MYTPKQKITGVFIGLFAAIAAASFIASVLNPSKNQNGQAQTGNSLTPAVTGQYSQLLVYGYWEPGKSNINTYDFHTQNSYVLAVLPENVKHVAVLPSGNIVYVNNTDKRDYGTGIAIYSLKNKTTATLFKADPGFGIDDYVVSPNGQYLAEFELQFAPGSSIVYGGNERVYSFDLLHPSRKQLIYNETIDKPIPYPRGITNDGKIFFDTWLPNSGDGWAYGMTVSDFTGANKQTIPSMINGTYGRQPMLSPDGKEIVFIGYDGNQGNGTDTDTNGIRKVITVPDTVELLDTTTLKRTKLPNLPNKNIYDFVSFDKTSNNLIITQLANGSSPAVTYFYDLNTQSPTKIPAENQQVLATVAPNVFLAGTPDTSLATIGNLGEGYQHPLIDFSLVNAASTQKTPLSAVGSFKQFIAFLPSDYLPKSLISQIVSPSNETLQLATFDLKPTLAPVRTVQQNKPPKDTDKERSGGGGATSGTSSSIDTMSMDCKPAIYLYPTTQEDVTVKLSIHGNLAYTDPIYPPDGWHVLANPDGSLVYGNRLYDYLYYEAKIPDTSISGDFQKTGYVVASRDLQDLFTSLLPKLGLNTKETQEFTDYWMHALPDSPYYRVSVIPQSAIDTFAPLIVNPVPDTILRVTLYFQALDQKIIISPPQFSEIKRSGFTVVEWGGLFKADKQHPFTCLM